MSGAPRYTLLVMLDEPRGNAATQGFATAQWNAAPTAGHIIVRLAPILGMLPATTTAALQRGNEP
jgi:cell division protein FtsI (penicillin-binding protein 3)